MEPSKPQIVTFALEKRPRATRASGSKVRTGCVTCKKRHVKCDETKPACLRCLKSKGACEGYETPKPEPRSAKRLVPKPATPRHTPMPTPTPSPTPERGSTPMFFDEKSVIDSNLASLATPIFANETEQQYFADWISLSATMAAGHFPLDFWSRTISETSYREPAIMYAALAVGSLSRALRSGNDPLMPTSCKELCKKEHYTNALSYHSRALGLARQASGAENGIRVAVLSCILFFCFDALAGEVETALRHLVHGTMILDQFINSQFGTAFKMMFQAPSSYLVEAEILQAFNLIAYNYLSHMCLLQPHTSLPAQCFLQQPPTLRANKIPAEFEDIATARWWWDLLLARISDAARTELRSTSQSADWVNAPEVCDITNEDRTVMESWHRAFSPLYLRVCESQTEHLEDFVRALHLEVQFLTHQAAICVLSSEDYTAIESLTPNFGEIVRLLELVLPHSPQNLFPRDAGFTMDMGYALSLQLVSFYCRERSVQEKAIRLLDQYPRRDGLWDSRSVAALAKFNLLVEEENDAEGDLMLQWDRLSHREVLIKPNQRMGTFRAMRRDPLEPGGWVLRDETFTW